MLIKLQHRSTCRIISKGIVIVNVRGKQINVIFICPQAMLRRFLAFISFKSMHKNQKKTKTNNNKYNHVSVIMSLLIRDKND